MQPIYFSQIAVYPGAAIGPPAEKIDLLYQF